MSASDGDPRSFGLIVGFDDVFYVPPGWLSWRCRLSRSRLDPGYVDGACQHDHDCDSWEQIRTETTKHLARWHPHVARSAPEETS